MGRFVRPLLLLLPIVALAACATAPPSPQQARLDACLKQADRNVIPSAQLEPNNRFSYVYHDTGGSGAEVEKFVACMQGRAPVYPTVK
jgi:hypothetical protein